MNAVYEKNRTKIILFLLLDSNSGWYFTNIIMTGILPLYHLGFWPACSQFIDQYINTYHNVMGLQGGRTLDSVTAVTGHIVPQGM